MDPVFKISRNFFLLLYVFYFAQGALYSQGTIFSQALLILILGISFFYFYKSTLLESSKNLFYRTWTFLLLLNVIGFIFTANFSNEHHINMFKGILLNSLPFYTTYYLAKKKMLTAKHLIWFLIIMLPVVVLRFQYNEKQVLLSKLIGNKNIVNNVAYSFAGLIPFVFLIKRRKLLSAAIMLFLMYFIITGAKRGAMISGVIGLIFYVYYQLKTIEGKNKLGGYFLAFIAVLLMLYVAYDTYQSNEYLVARMQAIGEKGGSSGRDRIYEDIFNNWVGAENVLNIIFGFGFAASLTMNRLGLFAHNDWLELLSNFGLFGAGIYLILFYAAAKKVRDSSWGKDKKIMMLTIVSLWFFATLVSMSYTSTTGGLQAIILGYMIGSKSYNIE